MHVGVVFVSSSLLAEPTFDRWLMRYIRSSRLVSARAVLEPTALVTHVEQVSSKGGAGSVIPVVCDLADPEQTAERIAAQLPIDLVVNNAGSSTLHSFLDTPLAEFDRTLKYSPSPPSTHARVIVSCALTAAPPNSVNLRGVLHVSQIVARDMVRRRHEGDRAPFAFVNISSQASKVALLNHTSYCCSKGGLDQLTRMMALELGPHQVRMVLICSSSSNLQPHSHMPLSLSLSLLLSCSRADTRQLSESDCRADGHGQGANEHQSTFLVTLSLSLSIST